MLSTLEDQPQQSCGAHTPAKPAQPTYEDLEEQIVRLKSDLARTREQLGTAEESAAYWHDVASGSAAPVVVDAFMTNAGVVRKLSEVPEVINLRPGKQLTLNGIWSAPVLVTRTEGEDGGLGDLTIIGGGFAFIPEIKQSRQTKSKPRR